MIQMPLSDMVDRYTILRLKRERLSDELKEVETKLGEEYAFFETALTECKVQGLVVREEWIVELYEINGQIWDLEADIRQGKEGLLGLEEVGRRALLIRDHNAKRVAVKNKIAQETGVGFEEFKINHASEARAASR